jgi:uncharacterized protein (TIGR02284 family)
MALDNHDVIAVLKDLIETSEDGIEGFRTAADSVDDATARALFLSRVPTIERGVTDLKGEIRRLGGSTEQHGSVAGALHRGWINLKSAITSKNEASVIAECERGEEHAASVYEQALRKELPAETRSLIDRQYRGVLQNLERVRSLRGGSGASAPSRTADRQTPPAV